MLTQGDIHCMMVTGLVAWRGGRGCTCTSQRNITLANLARYQVRRRYGCRISDLSGELACRLTDMPRATWRVKKQLISSPGEWAGKIKQNLGLCDVCLLGLPVDHRALCRHCHPGHALQALIPSFKAPRRISTPCGLI